MKSGFDFAGRDVGHQNSNGLQSVRWLIPWISTQNRQRAVENFTVDRSFPSLNA
jgi:hypothetical protein